MADSNEHGRAFEWAVRKVLEDYARGKGLEVERTAGTIMRDEDERRYFENFEDLQESLLSGARAFAGWIEREGWLDGASKLVLERVSDNEAKKKDVSDLRLHIHKKGDVETKNISLKHRHNALCHPRLPSLAQQCGIEGGTSADVEYRARYKQIWDSFYEKVKALGKPVEVYADLDKLSKSYRYDWLYVPLQSNAVKFLKERATGKDAAVAFFRYLVSDLDYYVVKNEEKYVRIKRFVNISPPSGFTVTYPYNSKTTFLVEFDNGWKVAFRVHTASSRIAEGDGPNRTEKLDPICINLEDVISVDDLLKEDPQQSQPL